MPSQLMSLPRRRWTQALPFLALVLQALPSTADELSVVATIKPVHALVAQVMGTTGSPELLVGGTTSPHTFAIKPSDVKKLARASVVFRVAEAVEPFTAKMVGQLPKGAVLVTLATAPGIATLPRRAGGPFEAHGHKGHDHDKHKHTNEAPSGGIDGHVWLDPANAAAMLDAIAATLAAKAPENATAYRANASAAKARLEVVAKEIAAELAPVAGKPFIIFHDATQYFEQRFGLTVAGSITVDPDVPASGKRLSALRAKVASSGAACVRSEERRVGKECA